MSIPMPFVAALRPAAARPDRGPAPLAAALALASCAALAAHAAVGLGAPLWLDEGGTGAFASLPSLADLLAAIRDDSNAPAYYVLIWAWAKLFGTSDVALHVPGLILSGLAPLAAWLGLRARRPCLALAWAAAVGLWGPGIVQSGYARCYPLLLLAAVLSCASFVRLIDAPTRGRAVAWAACGCLVVLTHYHGGWLIALQGLAWVALRPRAALRHWPAALAFAPAVGWMLWHMPRLAAYARPEVAWYRPLSIEDAGYAAATLLGVSPRLLPCAALCLLLVELSIQRGRAARSADRAAGAAERDAPVRIAGLVALAAPALFIGLSVLKPLYTARYLVAFAPGVLLFVAARLVAASRGRADLLAALVGGYGVLAALFWFGPPLFVERAFSAEAASAWIARAEPRRLAYFWDNPNTLAMPDRLLDLIGGFFLRRDGLAVDVVPVVLRPGADMNDALLGEVDGRTAILWLSDLNVHDTSVRPHPPRLAEMRPDLECRDFGAGPVGVYACRPRSGP